MAPYSNFISLCLVVFCIRTAVIAAGIMGSMPAIAYMVASYGSDGRVEDDAETPFACVLWAGMGLFYPITVPYLIYTFRKNAK